MGARREQLDFNDIPNRLFMDAVKTREIAFARPMTAEEKNQYERGAADIMIQPLIGESYTITRADLLSYFTYTNNKKIKTAGWESSKKYLVYMPDNKPVKVMQVPMNHTVEINGTVANSGSRRVGDYIVCNVTDQGDVDRESATILTSAVFKKLCYIPNNEVIERHKGSGNKYFSILTGAIRHIAQNSFIPSKSSLINNKQPIPSRNNPVRNNMNTGKPGSLPANTIRKPQIVSAKPLNNSDNTADYKLVAQIHDAYGKRVGYVVQSRSGETRNINKKAALSLASNKKLSNATVVAGPNGDAFLRGVGCRLEDLEITYQ